MLNSSVNFVVYCLVDQSFRQEIASMLRRTFCFACCHTKAAVPYPRPPVCRSRRTTETAAETAVAETNKL